MTQLKVETLGVLPSTWRDQSAVLGHASLTLKWNTLDFTLVDPSDTSNFNNASSPALSTATVRCVTLSWSGVAGSFETSDPVDIRNGHVFWRIAATNLATFLPPPGGPCMTLSDQPVTPTINLTLEDGSGPYDLEAGTLTAPGSLQLESGAVAYAGLKIKTQYNAATTPGSFIQASSVLGELTTFIGGLWPGLQFRLFSLNQGYAGTVFTVTETEVTFPVSGSPTFHVYFGLTTADIPIVLNNWKKV